MLAPAAGGSAGEAGGGRWGSGLELALDPAADDVDRVGLLVFVQRVALRDLVPALEARAAARRGGVLGDEDGVAAVRRLAPVLARRGGGDAGGEELLGVLANGAHPAELHDRAVAPAQTELGPERVPSYGVDPIVDEHRVKPRVVAVHPPVVTIGVYGSDLAEFLDALRAADVRLLVDVRQRRGVRGARYAWANARRLQAALAEAGIAYSHHRELAPTTELRHLQYAADDRLGVGKRSRDQIDPEYRERYIREILDHVDLDALVAEMPTNGASALFCVEADPEACHRSLIAERLAERYGVAVTHVRPSRPNTQSQVQLKV